jgi:hypothetical protein
MEEIYCLDAYSHGGGANDINAVFCSFLRNAQVFFEKLLEMFFSLSGTAFLLIVGILS